ncbi:MAG: cysteine desulfurase [Chloroflexi bacterium]|nr:cysteine desulfurase [Chloroflexota bacterium]MCC6893524.1 cysteine desulfurase [Anaerolineae bacterium]
MTNIYLDHSATTPVDPRVLQAMIPYFTEVYGNASSAHYFGRNAENAIEEARETIAAVLQCKPKEIIFTSGGSESDNLAIRGAAWAAHTKGKGTHLITSPIEHGAVGKTIDQLAAQQGFERTILPVDQYGFVNPDDFRAACKPGTTVASIMYANNEIGTIQPIKELASIAHENGVLFHTDAVQAAGQLSLDVNELGVDLLSLSGHKFYGPKGVGALYIRDGVEVTPAQTGGSHERGLRAGTQNTPLIVGLAEALRLAYEELETRTAHYKTVRDQLIGSIIANIPNAHLTGHGSKRLPAHASFVFENIQSGALIHLLDDEGIAASAASACKTGSPEPSSVLLALGYSRELAACTLRLTVGVQTKPQDIDYTVKTLATVVKSLIQQPASAQPVLA